MQKIFVPQLGESITEATVKSCKKAVGDFVLRDEVIAELETDKVALEVCSPCDGVIESFAVKKDDNVVVGDLIVVIDDTKSSADSNIKDTQKKKEQEPINTSNSFNAQKNNSLTSEKKGSPVASLIIAENNLDHSKVVPTGKDGRITKEDVLKTLNELSSSANNEKNNNVDVNFSTTNSPVLSNTGVPESYTGARSERIERMSKLRQRVAQRLKESQNTAAILTTFNEINMNAVIDIRGKYKDIFEKKYKIKLGFMSFFVKASVLALQEFPAINAEIRGTDIIFKNYCDIGIAVSTENGLVVPVLRNAEQFSLSDLEKQIADFGLKAKDGKLTLKDMEGGTFTITNGGIYGSLMSTPILNPPQSGILGMHAIQKRPIIDQSGDIKSASMMYVALSYDHRIVDGKEAVSFLVKIKNYIEDPERILLGI